MTYYSYSDHTPGGKTVRYDAILGTLLGLLLAGVSIERNIWRGDAHMVAVFPGLVNLLVVPFFFFVVLRRRHRTKVDREALQRSGRIIATFAAALFAIILSSFATFWYSAPRADLIAIALAGTFVITCAVGYLSVEVIVRLLRRAT